MENKYNPSKYFSLFLYFFSSLFLLGVAFFFYPKWQKKQTEATLSWDVSGYYLYLPAAFIYQDLKKVQFLDAIIQNYRPTPDKQQIFYHSSGNAVMKYSMGMAVQYFPYFIVGHSVAKALGYQADGFSKPYQAAISWGSLLIALLGLFLLRKNLKNYFDDFSVGITLLLLVFGTNYLDYSAINGAMSHNYLFTLYGILIALSITYHQNPSFKKGIAIGLVLGLMALSRPTEIIACLLPLLWGITDFSKKAMVERWQFLRTNFWTWAIAIIVCMLVGMCQLVYWKYVSGEWIVYSYQDQGFSWLRPHLYSGFLSYRAGWLVYTPMMFFALLGFIPLWKNQPSIFLAIACFSALFIYITFAWDIWWYGGSLGQRAMVQSYAVLAFPLAAFVQWIFKKSYLKWGLIGLALLFSYYNLWLTYQAHGGGLFDPDNMTKAYFWKILGRYDLPIEAKKLLDTDEEFIGERKTIELIYQNDFETDSSMMNCNLSPINGKQSLCLNAENQDSVVFKMPLKGKKADWVRAAANIRIGQKEWNKWRMTQCYIRFKNGEQILKERKIRLQRLLNDGATQLIFLDSKWPNEAVDEIEVYFWNGDGQLPILIDDLKIELFNS